MQPLWYLLAGLAIGAGAGGLVGWLLGARKAALSGGPMEAELRRQVAQRDAELAGVRAQAGAAESARAAAEAGQRAAEQQAEELQQQLALIQRELVRLRADLSQTAQALAAAEANRAAARTLLDEERARHEQHLHEARQAQDKALADLRQAFQALSLESLRAAQPEFLRLAGETFARLRDTAQGDLDKRQEAIAGLVKPLEELLRTYQQRLQQSETAQAASFGEIRKQVESLALQSEALANETQQFRLVLKSPPARGRWGEETLRRVVEAAGMSAHCDFLEQAQVDDKKPDLLVRLPGERLILVDAKVPDLDFLAALEEASPGKRAEALAAHAGKLRQTIRALAERNYPAQFPRSLDYVVLFLPAEALFSAALESDRDLIVWASERKILLATPASLIGLLRAVSVSWLQHQQTENAQKIAEAAQEFYQRAATFFTHFENLGEGLAAAAKAYNHAVGSYQRMVRPSGERLKNLGAGGGLKSLPEGNEVTETLSTPTPQG